MQNFQGLCVLKNNEFLTAVSNKMPEDGTLSKETVDKWLNSNYAIENAIHRNAFFLFVRTICDEYVYKPWQVAKFWAVDGAVEAERCAYNFGLNSECINAASEFVRGKHIKRGGTLLNEQGGKLIKKFDKPSNSNKVSNVYGQRGTGAKFKDQQRLNEHYNDYKDDFGAKSPQEYAQMADDFMTGTKEPHVQEKIRSTDGATLRYDATTGEFGVVGKDGIIQTYYKPAPRSQSNPRGYGPNKHSSPQDYFDNM